MGGGRGWVTPTPAKSPSLQESSYFPPEAGGCEGGPGAQWAPPRTDRGGSRDRSPLEKTLYYFENRNPPPVPTSHPPPLISLTGGGRGWVTPKPAKSPSLQESSHKKSLPMLPRANHGPTPGFFGPNPGQFGSELGYFGSILGRFRAFPGQNHADLGPVSPPEEPPSPRGACKNFTSQPVHADAPSPPRFP